MRPSQTRISPLAALLLPAVLIPAGCGDSPEKKELMAYEASIDGLVAQDKEVLDRLTELKGDIDVGNQGGGRIEGYVRDEALPFYRRFDEELRAVPEPSGELKDIHALLLEYSGHVMEFLDATGNVIRISRSEAFQTVAKQQDPWRKALGELLNGTKGDIQNAEAAEILKGDQQFLGRTYEPFLRGQVQAEEVGKKLRGEILPRIARFADSTEADRSREGVDGLIARWAKAEVDFLRAISGSLEQHEAQVTQLRSFLESWERLTETRRRFLERLEAYRNKHR